MVYAIFKQDTKELVASIDTDKNDVILKSGFEAAVGDSESKLNSFTESKGLEKPKTKLTKDDVLSTIKGEDYTILNDGRTTICQLTLKNGFTVVGFSACVDPKNFDKELGQSIAKDNAVEKVWELEGYLLRQRLFEKGLVE